MPAADLVSSSPRVSILVLNYNGRVHLETCLPSLDAQVYPKDQYRIEVIDNGSTDDSVAFVEARYPHAIVHRFDRNRGFAAPYDEVVRRCDSEYVALLNNDTRVEPTWLAELVSAAQRHEAQCVASRILDWDGRRIDFVGGLVSFVGHAWQLHFGEPVDAHEYEERPLLFACGGSMLIARDVYVDAGGFDTDFFAYFEDVDLGWRLSLLGYRVVLAPRAVTYHRLHGTAGRIALAQRLRLYERNALATIYKNYDDETLGRVLPAAVALSLLRGLMHSGIDARGLALGSTPPAELDVTARTVVHLLALEDLARQLPELQKKRAWIQRRRRRSDREITALFGDPFRLHEGGRYEEVARALIQDFDVASLLTGGGSTAGSAGTSSAAPPSRVQVSEPPPSISIVVLTVIGPTHLPDCLSSLRAQTYPARLREVIVVDNASPEDPTAVAEEYYPGVRVIRNQANLGFAAANNIGARAATGHYVAFLNDDTRVHPDWVSELVATAQNRGAACVGSRILSWDGARIDFVGGSVNCEGKGFQIDIGQPQAGRHTEERPLMFACGGAMLIERELLLAAGGWDEGTFAYYEDVELGWRLWLLGHEVWYSPRSIVYHKHHGSSGRWPMGPRVRLYERNSLRMLYTHLERETLQRVLPAALMLVADRALLATGLSRASADAGEIPPRERARHGHTGGLRGIASRAKAALRSRGATRTASRLENLRRVGIRGLADVARQVVADAGPAAPWARAAYQIERGTAGLALDGRTERFPVIAAAALSGMHEFIESIPALSERRRMLQAARRRTDREIIGRFGAHWLSPSGSARQEEHEALHRILLDGLGILELVPHAGVPPPAY